MKRIIIAVILLAALALLCACSANGSAPNEPAAQAAVTETAAAAPAGSTNATEHTDATEQTDVTEPTSEPELPRIEPWDGKAGGWEDGQSGDLIIDWAGFGSIDELEERSDAVVYVKVKASGYEKHVFTNEYYDEGDPHSYPYNINLYSVYDAEIIDVYKGDPEPGGTVKISIMRGMEEDGRQYVVQHTELHKIETGREYVLFITKDSFFDERWALISELNGICAVTEEAGIKQTALGFGIDDGFAWLENLKNTH